eukprot:TRINITY_DN13400_c0_g1_i1.p1 TRINITY_DN13400_c0_g1~~TRINITY_DN13400_c0_g1_i1.p1  ORF type:complete len:173 (+),score=18.33 TRINITY_DN13400_c0_g1_i1:56-574(+)
MVFCTQCGAQAGAGARFCAGCGTPIASAAAPTSPKPTGAPRSNPTSPQSAPRSQTTSPQSAPRSHPTSPPSAPRTQATTSYASPSSAPRSAPSNGASRGGVSSPARPSVTAVAHGQARGQQSFAAGLDSGPTPSYGNTVKVTYEKQPSWAFAEQHKNSHGQYKHGQFRNNYD